MVRKKSVKKLKTLDQEIQEVENWIKERRKFFIKLGIVLILVIILIIISNYYLKINGIGV